MYKGKIKYILILMILILIIIIFTNETVKKSFDDVVIFGLWEDLSNKNEFEITSENDLQIDVFKTIYKGNKKIAPGSYGNFIIKKTGNSNFKIKVNENNKKPQNLVFILDGNVYNNIKDLEPIINNKFLITDKIKIDWKWEYEINSICDEQDTIDGTAAQKYIFEVEAVYEER